MDGEPLHPTASPLTAFTAFFQARVCLAGDAHTAQATARAEARERVGKAEREGWHEGQEEVMSTGCGWLRMGLIAIAVAVVATVVADRAYWSGGEGGREEWPSGSDGYKYDPLTER